MKEEKSIKSEKLSFIDKLNQFFNAELWRKIRNLFKMHDASEDAISGIDITDYLAPGALKLRSMHSIVQLISKIHKDVGKDAIFIGVERKGFVFAGALLNEFGETDISLKRSRQIKEKDVKNKIVVLIDDASKSGKKIIEETRQYQKFGAKIIIAIVALATKDAVKNVKKQFKTKDMALFSHKVCEDENEYGELYPVFYHIVSSSIIPVTGEPKAEIEFQTFNLDVVVKTLCKLPRGECICIDSIEDSYPARGTIDYYQYALDNDVNKFKQIGEKTGFFLKLDQAKIRMYFDFDGRIKVKLCPIVYLEIPENIECRGYKKCQKTMDLVGEPVLCAKCIEDMIGDVLLNILKEDLEKKATALKLKYKFKKL